MNTRAETNPQTRESGLSRPPASEGTGDTVQLAERLRTDFLQLQALVTVVLSYQVLFATDVGVSQETALAAILGMLSLCGLLMVLPTRVIGTDWFPGILADRKSVV